MIFPQIKLSHVRKVRRHTRKWDVHIKTVAFVRRIWERNIVSIIPSIVIYSKKIKRSFDAFRLCNREFRQPISDVLAHRFRVVAISNRMQKPTIHIINFHPHFSTNDFDKDEDEETHHPKKKSRARSAALWEAAVFRLGLNQWVTNVIPICPFCFACTPQIVSNKKQDSGRIIQRLI